MKDTLLEINIKNDKRVIPDLAYFVSESAYKLGLSKRQAKFLCFTLETILELRADAIDENNPEIKLQVIDNGSSFKFVVNDLGSPYILTKNQQAILKYGLVEKYSFVQNGRKGQSLSFNFKYEHRNTVDVEEKKSEERILDEEFIYERLEDSDESILEAIKCLYAAYGYDYYHQHLYSVESFKKYIQSGRYVPVVCHNKHNQVMCYCALDENTWFLGIPEFSNLVTKPIARGKGLASNIFKETEKIAKEMNYEGIHVSAVAYHSYTQKMSNKLNYTPCSIEYSINPAGTGGYDDTRRLDCVIGIKIFNKTRKHDLYINSKCNDMISGIFDAEKLNYEIHNQINNNNEETLIAYSIDVDTNNCFMKIDACGKDFENEIIKTINTEEVKQMDVITINLNMNNESSINGYDILRKLGFICVGCLPGSLNGDYLLMQSYKIEPQYEKIVLEDNYHDLLMKVYKLNDIKL